MKVFSLIAPINLVNDTICTHRWSYSSFLIRANGGTDLLPGQGNHSLPPSKLAAPPQFARTKLLAFCSFREFFELGGILKENCCPPFQVVKNLRRLPKISLSRVLVVPFVTQIFIAVGLTGYWSLRHGQIAIEQLVSQLSNESSKRVDQHLSSYLLVPHQINQVNARSLESGLLSKDLRKLGHFFWEQMRAHPEFAFIDYADQQGNFVGINRDHQNILQMDIVEPPHIGYYYRYDITKGKPSRFTSYKVPYDARKEIWYSDALNAKKPLWTSIYFWSDDKVLAISSSHPVMKNGEVVGVVGIDYLLHRISDFLSKLRPSPSATVFIVERNGLLVANSTKDSTYAVVNNEAQRVKGTESSNPTIRAITKQLIHTFGDLKHIQSVEKAKVKIDNHTSFVQVTPWRDAYGLDWLVVVAIPESDFTQQINQNAKTTILLCMIALGVTSYLGLLTARWISRSITRLNQASFAIAQGDLNQTVEISKIDELAALARSFNSMVAQMRASFIALEQTNAELEMRVEERTEDLTAALKNLQMAQAQMVQTEKMSSLGQMVAGIAHEINNPVTFISGNLTHIERYTADLMTLVRLYEQHCTSKILEIEEHIEECDLNFIVEDLPKLLESMQDGADRIQAIVLSLRNFSRLDEAQLKLVDLQDGLDNTLLLLQHRLKHTTYRREIQVIKDFAQLPKVECYAGQINQVFLSILSNAIDALDAHSGMISIATEATTAAAIVRIRDNGEGIPESVLPKIFDPFFTTKPIGQGTGLGLSIAYQIVVGQHHGSLSCTSEVEKGTEFTIEIPITIQKQLEDSRIE
jgi:signal transduction histidine kinase